MTLAIYGCGGGESSVGGNDERPDWTTVKAQAVPHLALPEEFEAPATLSVTNAGWEDGLFISRDGLRLFAFYAPVDLISWELHSGDPGDFSDYLRGPTLGMDLSWILHGDIVVASRTSTDQPFSSWRLSGLSGSPYTQGAPQYIPGVGRRADIFVYTDNNEPDGVQRLRILRDIDVGSLTSGTAIPAPIRDPAFRQDNPHIERLSDTELVLFYDTDDVGCVSADLIIKYSLSTDNGATWSTPMAVTSINTHSSQQGPHLWKNPGNDTWYLYYGATNPADGKLGVFRSRQSIPGDWDSWVEETLVVGAGNTHAVGEPSLTANGDLYFVTILEHTDGTPADRYDNDPWMARKK
jgi:hypothetical protein